MEELDSKEKLQDARQRSFEAPVVLYKHSSTCGLSLFARREVNALQKAAGVPVYVVIVQRAREISNAIEHLYGIRHESPQVLVVHRDEPIYHASHGRIRASTMKPVIDDVSAPR